MPGTPDPAAAAPVPVTASQAWEGDGGDTVLRAATSRYRRWKRCPSGGCSGMGSGHWSAPFSELALGRKAGVVEPGDQGSSPRGEGLGAEGWVRMGALGRARVSPLLAPARGTKTHPWANRSPGGGDPL